MHKISIIIPIYNEELYVKEILDQILLVSWPAGVKAEVVVIDDGSTDDTPNILKNYSENNIVRVHSHLSNFGKGTAIREAIRHITGDIVIIQDADREYSISDYPALLEPLLNGTADVVYGSRFLGSISGMQLRHRVFNKLMCWLSNLLFSASITDEATAYKLFRADVLRSLNLKSERFEICPEMTAKVLKHHLRLREVPIHYRARSIKEGKKIRWTDGLHAILTLIRYRIFNP
jgi:glycosyltransferase involved in cell wall biosynthesis